MIVHIGTIIAWVNLLGPLKTGPPNMIVWGPCHFVYGSCNDSKWKVEFEMRNYYYATPICWLLWRLNAIISQTTLTTKHFKWTINLVTHQGLRVCCPEKITCIPIYFNARYHSLYLKCDIYYIILHSRLALSNP